MRLLMFAGLALAAVAAGIVAVFWLAQRRLIYAPQDAAGPPARWLPGALAVELDTEDRLRLGGWFLPGSGAAGVTVLVFNGNAGHRGDRAPLGRALAERGYAVLLFDYRGYGGNPGRPSEQGLLRDARAARAFLERRPDVRAERIVYFGESLGAAVAVAAAAERPPAALVLRSPFTSLVDVARVHYPFLPVALLARDRYPSLERIRGFDRPLLVAAGTGDAVVPFEQSRRLFDAAASPVKRLLVFEGAGHDDPELVAGRRLAGAVAALLREAGLEEVR